MASHQKDLVTKYHCFPLPISLWGRSSSRGPYIPIRARFELSILLSKVHPPNQLHCPVVHSNPAYAISTVVGACREDERLDQHDGEGNVSRWGVADAGRGARRRHVRHQEWEAGGVRRGPPHTARRPGLRRGRAGLAVSHAAQRKRQGQQSPVRARPFDGSHET